MVMTVVAYLEILTVQILVVMMAEWMEYPMVHLEAVEKDLMMAALSVTMKVEQLVAELVCATAFLTAGMKDQ